MTKLGSRKLHIYPEVAKVESIIGHRIDYQGVGDLRGQRHIPQQILTQVPHWVAIMLCMNKQTSQLMHGVGVVLFKAVVLLLQARLKVAP